jgi:uncharacterized cupin superfamily protein
MTLAHVHRLTDAGAPEEAEVAAPKRVAGSGLTRTWNGYSAGGFFAGLWSHGPGVLAVDYTETELCVILEGRVRLAGDAGSVEFAEGDAFVIAPGFRGTWESVGRVTKAYAILEPGQARR